MRALAPEATELDPARKHGPGTSLLARAVPGRTGGADLITTLDGDSLLRNQVFNSLLDHGRWERAAQDVDLDALAIQ